MGDLQEQTARAAMAQPRVITADPGVQVEQEPAWTGFVHVFMPGSDDCCNALLMTGSPRLTGKVRCGHVEEAPIHLQPAPLARVGDVIEHGQPIPGNVVRMRDGAADVLDPETSFWVRRGPGRFSWRGHGDAADLLVHGEPEWFPLTVVEVDPEPQPADPSQPVVLRLPEVPEGTVALIGSQTGWRYVLWGDGTAGLWHSNDPDGGTEPGSFGALLHAEGGEVTVEFAPPREPRTWPKLDDAPDTEDPPAVVDLFEPNRSPLRFVRTTGARGSTRYIEPGHPLPTFTLTELRELGDVAEVLS